MLDQIQILAAATDSAAAEGGGLGELFVSLMERFHIKAPLLVAQIVNFTIVAVILWKFAFKPVMAAIEERQRKIEDGLQYAEEMKARLSDAEEQSAQKLREAEDKAAKIVHEARDNAKSYAEKQQQDAIHKAENIVHKAEQAMEQERKQMLAELREEVAQLVVRTSQTVLARELDDEERKRFSNAAAEELSRN